jgi:hypothetical protein
MRLNGRFHRAVLEHAKAKHPAAALKAAWINDLQRGCLESGVFIASPGTPSVDRALARLPEVGVGASQNYRQAM